MNLKCLHAIFYAFSIKIYVYIALCLCFVYSLSVCIYILSCPSPSWFIMCCENCVCFHVCSYAWRFELERDRDCTVDKNIKTAEYGHYTLHSVWWNSRMLKCYNLTPEKWRWNERWYLTQTYRPSFVSSSHGGRAWSSSTPPCGWAVMFTHMLYFIYLTFFNCWYNFMVYLFNIYSVFIQFLRKFRNSIKTPEL